MWPPSHQALAGLAVRLTAHSAAIAIQIRNGSSFIVSRSVLPVKFETAVTSIRKSLDGLENKKRTSVHGRSRPPRPLSLRCGPHRLPPVLAEGAYRLARLAAKFGPEITLRDLTNRFSYDCMWRAEARSKKGKSACGVYLPDLEHKRPPDLPPGMVKLRLVKGD